MFDDDNKVPYKGMEFLLSEMEVSTEHGLYWDDWNYGTSLFTEEQTVDIVDEAIWRMMQ